MTPPKYEIVDSKNAYHDDHWCIKILDGDFAGLVYQYDVVKIQEDEDEAGSAEVTFNTITVENPNNLDLTEEQEQGIMGSILIDIIQSEIEKLGDEQDNENGTSDTENAS
jgi:hypothetical protein